MDNTSLIQSWFKKFWQKIKDTFATKTEVTTAVNNVTTTVNNNINTINSKVKFTELRFAINKSTTSAPTLNRSERNPSGWNKIINSNLANDDIVWLITATINSNDTINGGMWSQPVRLSGVNGKDGKDGKDGTSSSVPGTSSYFHIAWADKDESDNIINFSLSDVGGREYLGTLVDNNSVASTNFSDYTWQKVVGAQGKDGKDGIAGTNGADGKTSYLHIKYSNNNGLTFTSNDGEDPGWYIGQYVDFTQADSNDPTKYKWSKIKGEDGRHGTSVTILGSFTSESELTDSGDNTVAGNAYMIGSNLYIWDGTQWKNVGKIKGDNGRDGINGTNGKSSFLHIAWANSEDGVTDFSVNKVSGVEYTYMGLYTDELVADSSNPADYIWSRIKGDAGNDGKDGIPAAVKLYFNASNKNSITIDSETFENSQKNIIKRVSSPLGVNPEDDPIINAFLQVYSIELKDDYAYISNGVLFEYINDNVCYSPNYVTVYNYLEKTGISDENKFIHCVEITPYSGVDTVKKRIRLPSTDEDDFLGPNFEYRYYNVPYLIWAISNSFMVNFNPKDGADGHSGAIPYQMGTYDVNTTYTKTLSTVPYVLDTLDNNYYLLNTDTWLGTNKANLNPSESVARGDKDWIKFDNFDSIITNLGIIDKGMIGAAVYSGDYMISQYGINPSASNASTNNYQNFDANHIYDGTFTPNIMINFKTGEGHFSAGKVKFNSNGVNVNGEINATKGTIGGFTINTNQLIGTTKETYNKNSEFILSPNLIRYHSEKFNSYTWLGGNVLPSHMSGDLVVAALRAEVNYTTTLPSNNIGFYIDVKGSALSDSAVNDGNHALYVPNGVYAGFRLKTRRVSTNGDISKLDNILLITSSVSIKLPTDPEDGQLYYIRRINNVRYYIKSDSSNIIWYGEGTKTELSIADYKLYIFIYDAANDRWFGNGY